MPYNKKPKLTNKLSAKMVYPKMAEYGYMKPKMGGRMCGGKLPNSSR